MAADFTTFVFVARRTANFQAIVLTVLPDTGSVAALLVAFSQKLRRKAVVCTLVVVWVLFTGSQSLASLSSTYVIVLIASTRHQAAGIIVPRWTGNGFAVLRTVHTIAALKTCRVITEVVSVVTVQGTINIACAVTRCCPSHRNESGNEKILHV